MLVQNITVIRSFELFPAFAVYCTTRRVNSKRDLFEALTSMNIVRDHRNRIIHQFIEL